MNFDEDQLQTISSFISKNMEMIIDESGINQNDPYWGQVNLVYQQLIGMWEGYVEFAPAEQRLTKYQFYLLNYQTEVADLANVYSDNSINIVDPKTNMFEHDHCSVLVKLSPDGSNLFSSHVTWTTFATMLRIWKHYNFPYTSLNSTVSNLVSFSGYPGYIPSGDDWYLTDQHLTIAETTNSVFNMSLYEFVTPNTVPYWIRVMVANKMATNGKEWVDAFAMYNSGTYNNQWIVVDYKLFVPKQPLVANTLWIAEQIPGYVISADKTDVLKATNYWASYNIPYFPFVYNISGYPSNYDQFGDSYSYSMCPRAQIFRRDEHTVTDMPSMKRIMRYNEWQTDPLSLGDSCNSISARCDLDPPANDPQAFGAIDAKVSDFHHVKKGITKAVNGPTWDSQPVFAWTEEWSDIYSGGMVKVFDFEFVDM